jgi:hypothetical protein
MATVAQLAARTYQEIAWLFVIEGWDVAFTNRPDLVGSGGGSWIGTAHGARTVALGLEPPEAVKLGIGIVDSGLPVDDGLTVTIVDRDGHLISFMKDEPGDVVAERLGPLDDPAPATLLGPQGETVAVWGRHVNGEAIGAAGERRQFFVLPGVTMPGLDHPAIGSDDGAGGLRVSAVRDDARWLEGRMCTTPPAPVLWGQIRDWSKATFGPGRRTKGLLEHIRRELDEVAANPDDLVEWVDVVLLAFDGYWRHGGTPEGFMDMVRYKFSVNQARKWPPPAPDDQPNHHVEEPTAPALEPRRAGWRKRAQEALGDPASSARSCAGPAPHATRVSTRPRTDRGVGAALTPNWKRSAQNPADRSRAGRARSGRASAGTSWAAIWARNQCACPRSWTRRRPGA